ncbi:MAG: hypothetical protein R6V58_06625 [Planctomycetota bacterium]
MCKEIASVVILGLFSASCAAQEQVVFSWTPGDARAATQAGEVAFALADGARLVDCPAGRGVVPNKDGRIGACDVTLGDLPETGTLSIWLKPSRELRLARKGKAGSAALFQCADLTLRVSEARGAVGIGLRAGELQPTPWMRSQLQRDTDAKPAARASFPIECRSHGAYEVRDQFDPFGFGRPVIPEERVIAQEVQLDSGQLVLVCQFA